MTRDRARRNFVPIVWSPTKLVHQRRECQTSVSSPTRNHDLRATIERFNHWRRAKINVGALNPVAYGCERGSRIHVAQLDSTAEKFVQLCHYVVAGNDADAKLSGKAKIAGNFPYCTCTAGNVDAASVRSDANVSLNTRRQYLLHQRYEIFRITR